MYSLVNDSPLILTTAANPDLLPSPSSCWTLSSSCSSLFLVFFLSVTCILLLRLLQSGGGQTSQHWPSSTTPATLPTSLAFSSLSSSSPSSSLLRLISLQLFLRPVQGARQHCSTGW